MGTGNGDVERGDADDDGGGERARGARGQTRGVGRVRGGVTKVRRPDSVDDNASRKVVAP